ncbi:uncharacterized protein LOC123272826 [Cotesia glomerata]|uniref:Uncharacterized protein n=1 Tax=Cotesia glomerata TaxID=32391 RepID=A0AAV7J3M2_COTGL|nr:uncharacterized protein LOC123272826 [Cotesia glomerata]KAH0564416.1 hypothetical protein KQX54_011963 [Cotesia glomerata]
MELLVPAISDIIFQYPWTIKNYKKIIEKNISIDSPAFELNVNGIRSSWNLSIRFWKGPEGKRLKNPVVLCLNMLNCKINSSEQAKIRFQFGIYNTEVNQWEYFNIGRTIIELKSTEDIVSLGYRELSVVERHLKNGVAKLVVKIQMTEYDSDKQEPARLTRHLRDADTKFICSKGQDEIPGHANVKASHSDVPTSIDKSARQAGDQKTGVNNLIIHR